MDELISRSLKSQTSPEEEERLRAWRESDPANEARQADIAWLMRASDDLLEHTSAPPPPSAEGLVQRAAPRWGRGERTRGGWRRPAARWGGGLALLAAAMLAWFVLLPAVRRGPSVQFGAGEFATGPGETGTLVLGDGSVVRLAPNSRLSVPGVRGSRELFLSGTAYFSVVRMPDAPFRVRTDAGDAVVLGTRFELRTREDDLRLVVLEGAVSLGARGEPVVVRAGEMSRVSQGTASPAVKVADVGAMVSWLRRFIVFQDTPLREAAVELEHEYGVRIEVTDSALAQQTLTGWYADKELDDVLTLVCGVLQARCTVQDSVVTIDRGP